MSKTVIKVENLSKLYRLGQVSTGTISHDLNRWWAKFRGKEDPFAKVGSVNDRTKKADSEYAWALKDVNFEIKQGDAVGVVGKNGAGKSTLLKLLSRVTSPTQGSIKVKGRIASLLEVGTGFHPELTGRENIYLNGAILGMTKWEIKNKFDEIVDFAGVERYIDTPVKRYSSGMYVRLAFGVAAHLESEILIIDEVLAVGDAEFQKKCIGKMNDVSKSDGRTILFVSHNMGAINSLCDKGILMQNGLSIFSGDVGPCIEKYLSSTNKSSSTSNTFIPPKNNPLVIHKVQLLKNGAYTQSNSFDFLDKIGFELDIECKENIKNRGIIIHCHDSMDHLFSSFDISVKSELLESRGPGKYKLMIDYPSPILKAGNYSFDLEVGFFGGGPEQLEKNAINIDIDILSRNPRFESAALNRPGKFYVEPSWEYIKL